MTFKAATTKLIVSHDFDIVKPTLPPGKKRTVNLSKIKGSYYGPPKNNAKHGFMTFNMVNICVKKKFPNFAIFAKIVMHAKISWSTVDMSENMFFFHS